MGILSGALILAVAIFGWPTGEIPSRTGAARRRSDPAPDGRRLTAPLTSWRRCSSSAWWSSSGSWYGRHGVHQFARLKVSEADAFVGTGLGISAIATFTAVAILVRGHW